MMCRNPFFKGGVAFKCGQCMPCRVNQRRVWTHRIMLESLEHTDNAFVTVTYDPEKMPRLPDGRGNLIKKDYQDWFKRLRKEYKEQYGRYFRYALVGEYGDVTQRPHFHAALFGFPSCAWGQSRYKFRTNCCASCDMVRDTWGHGHVFLGDLTTNSAQYVAGYVTKKMTKKDDPRLDGRNPEFFQPSLKPHGLGAGMLWDVASALMQHDLEDSEVDVPSTLRHGNRLLPLGRYLQRKLRTMVGRDEKTPDEIIEKIRETLRPLQEGAQANADASGRKYSDELRMLYLQAGDQAVANLEAKQRINKKRGSI